MGGNRLKVNDKIYEVTPGIQKLLTDTCNIPMKKINDKHRELIIIILKSLDFEGYKAIRGESKSGRNKQSKTIFRKLANQSNLEGQGVKFTIPSDIIDLYTRLEILLGQKLSGHIDTLTEASNLVVELNKRDEIQNKQHFGNALDKFST